MTKTAIRTHNHHKLLVLDVAPKGLDVVPSEVYPVPAVESWLAFKKRSFWKSNLAMISDLLSSTGRDPLDAGTLDVGNARLMTVP